MKETQKALAFAAVSAVKKKEENRRIMVDDHADDIELLATSDQVKIEEALQDALAV